jgi:hypothetical protein
MALRLETGLGALALAMSACSLGSLGDNDRVDASRTTDAAPDPDAAPNPDGACSMGWVQLLVNRDFEDGHSSWTESPASGVIGQLGAGLPFAPHLGSDWAACINAYSQPETLSQTVIVPPSATALRLHGYKCYVTDDTADATDTFAIQLLGGGTETLESLDNLDVPAVCDWEYFEYEAASAYAGQSVTLRFHGEADGSDWTSYVIDTLALEAYACL